MATSTEVAIATTTLGSAASTITFSSIPSTYTDLRLVITFSKETATSQTSCVVRFNSDTGTNYSFTSVYGNGTSAASTRSTNDNYIYANFMTDATSASLCFTSIDVFSYAGSTYKTVLTTGSGDKNGSGAVERIVGLWRSTSAINTVALISQIGNFAAGTTATLYGIL